MCLQRCLTLNRPHGRWCAVLSLWFPRRWHRPIIAIAAVTACAAVRAEGADVCWPAGQPAISILAPSWKQITLFTWAAIGWQMGLVRRWSFRRVCLKRAATRRGPAIETVANALCSGALWALCDFNLCLVTGRGWKWTVRVAAHMPRRADLVAQRCFCYFRPGGGRYTSVLSMNPRQQRSIRSFTRRRGLCGRGGRRPGYGLTPRRGWTRS